MITIIAAVLGAALGAITALRRGGKTMDALQYGAGYGIAFILLGILVTIILDRTLLG